MRFGIILVNTNTSQLYVVRRINYVLWNLINNINLNVKDPYSNKGMFYVHYPGVDLFLEFPKGVKETKETGFTCAVREFFEETGILIDKTNAKIISEIRQQFVGSNKKTYVVLYYVIDDKEIKHSRDTVVKSVENPTVLSDNFNVLIYTKWAFIRDFFPSINSTLDTIFGGVSSKK